jgi:hypothetical protein
MGAMFEDETTLSARERLRAYLRSLDCPRSRVALAATLSAALEFLEARASRRLPRGERVLLLGATQRAAQELADRLTREKDAAAPLLPVLPSSALSTGWSEPTRIEAYDVTLDSCEPSPGDSLEGAIIELVDRPFDVDTDAMLPRHLLHRSRSVEGEPVEA